MRARGPALLAGVAASVVLYGTARASDSVEVRVLGTIRVDAEREGDGAVTRVSGSVYDDLGRPLTTATLRFAGVVRRCASAIAPSAEHPVGPAGDFCVEVPGPRLSEGAEVLAPDHTPLRLSLEMLLKRTDGGTGRLEVVEHSRLWDPEGVERTWNVGFRWRGENPTGAIRGELRCSQNAHTIFTRDLEDEGPTYVSVSDDPEVPAGPCAVEIGASEGDRAGATVEVTVRRPVRVEVKATSDGIYSVHATAKNTARVGGMLEIRGRDERYVAGATLDSEKSSAVLDLSHVPDERLTIHYHPNRPWFLSTPPLAFEHVQPRPFFGRAWFQIALFSSLVLLVIGRFVRRESGAAPPSVLEGPAASPPPGGRRSALRGTVVDAHTGEPVPRATVELLEKTATTSRIRDRTFADESGAFEFEVRASPSLELSVSSATHLTVRVPTRVGPLEIALTGRRRALLGAFRTFVLRARVGRSGQGPFPTPEQARIEATLEEREKDAQWAEAVDQLAFGPEEPNERAVEALAMFPGRNVER